MPTDTFGAVEIPIAVAPSGEAVADPALTVLLDYFKAYLNQNAHAAWQAVQADTLPVQSVFACDPKLYPLNPEHLPALFLYRPDSEAQGYWRSEDEWVEKGTLRLFWVFPAPSKTHLRRRDSFTNGIAKCLHAAIFECRIQAYVMVGDTDTTAASQVADVDAIKLSVATSTSQQVYTGAALDGLLGGTTFSPQRAFSLTQGGTLGSFTAGSLVTIVGTTSLGSQTDTIAIGALGTRSTLTEWRTITSVTVAAQASTAGTLSFGVTAHVGAGTVVLDAAGLDTMTSGAKWNRVLAFPLQEGGAVHSFDALEMALHVEETWAQDVSRYYQHTVNGAGLALGGTDLKILHEDGSVLETSHLPDAGIVNT